MKRLCVLLLVVGGCSLLTVKAQPKARESLPITPPIESPADAWGLTATEWGTAGGLLATLIAGVVIAKRRKAK